jgi:hypothetical protein
VGEHVGAPLVDHHVDRVEVPREVTDQRLDQEIGAQRLQARHRLGDVRGASVEQIVAVDHGEHHVLKRHRRDGPRHVLGLAHVDLSAGVAGRHGAEAAAARADVAEQHHGRGALAPALAHVRAAGLFADGVQVELAERLFERVERLASGGADLQPLGLGRVARLAHGGQLARARPRFEPTTTTTTTAGSPLSKAGRLRYRDAHAWRSDG